MDWEAINALTSIFRLVKDIFKDKPLQTSSQDKGKETNSDDTQDLTAEEINATPYQVELGKRHNYLREKILELNPREMADFYGYEKVAELEKYERGEDEFPTSSIKRLIEVFFINPKYLQEGKKQIFKNFSLLGDDDCRKFLNLGFTPYILCRGDDRWWLCCYIVFYKNDDGYHRIIVSDRYGSFASSGGGKQNIFNLIYPMISYGKNWTYAHVLRVEAQTWQSLGEGTFYRKGMYGWTVDAECEDIFVEWYRVCKERFEKANFT